MSEELSQTDAKTRLLEQSKKVGEALGKVDEISYNYRWAEFYELWTQGYDSLRGTFSVPQEKSAFAEFSSRGWKIHIAIKKHPQKSTQERFAQMVAKELYCQGLYFKVETKMGTYFNGNNACGLTIYIGSFDNMQKVAHLLQEKAAAFLTHNRPIRTQQGILNIGSGADTEVLPMICTRFDVLKTPLGWIGAAPGELPKYAEAGIGGFFRDITGLPVLQKYEPEVAKLQARWNDSDRDQRLVLYKRLREIYEESKNELIKDFGEEYVMGSGSKSKGDS